MKKILIWFPVAMLILSTGCKPRVPRIVLPENPSPVESLAASEIRRYIYLRNGELANIAESDKSFSKGTVIQIERMNAAGAEEFYLKTMSEGNLQKIIVSGGSDIAILYGAYELAEQLGIRFYMHGDVVPDEKIPFNLPELDMRRKPLFSVRGILPFHDFATGPDWWNENDYKAIIAQLPKMKMNFIGFHTYPYRSNIKDIIYNAEPLVWIGKKEDVNADGTVNNAYPTMHFHTNDSTWGHKRTKTSEFNYGASQIFETDKFGADYMKDLSDWPHTDNENINIFNESGKMFREAFIFANQLGVKTCVGTETPLTIPQKLKDQYGITKESDQWIKDLYQGMFHRIQQTFPIDYYWLWTPENWCWQSEDSNNEAIVAKTEKDMLLAHEVLRDLGKPFQLAVSGWVLGPPQDRTQFNRILPEDVPISCINNDVGYTMVEEGFQTILERPKWAIPWLEDDIAMMSTQLWVGRLRKDALDSYRYGCDGLIGIHWRTRDLGPNVSALAKSAWEADQWDDEHVYEDRDLEARDFYTDWIKSEFGLANEELVDLLVRLDSKGVNMKQWPKRDSPLKSSDWFVLMVWDHWSLEEIAERVDRYTFLSDLNDMRKLLTGAGNLERFDYWFNSLKFNKLQLETALAIKKLRFAIEEINQESDGDKMVSLAREKALPIRLQVAMKWKEMSETLLAKVSTNGDLGMIANLEMANLRKNKFLTENDGFFEQLGIELPPEAFPVKTYQGDTRLIVTTNQSLLPEGEDFYLRVRVLSQEKNISGKLMWRNLGEGSFYPVELKQMDRHVFEVSLPWSDISGDYEYYIEVSAGNQQMLYPATAPGINQTVVIFHTQ